MLHSNEKDGTIATHQSWMHATKIKLRKSSLTHKCTWNSVRITVKLVYEGRGHDSSTFVRVVREKPHGRLLVAGKILFLYLDSGYMGVFVKYCCQLKALSLGAIFSLWKMEISKCWKVVKNIWDFLIETMRRNERKLKIAIH